jgi:hypothetical protein
LGKFAMADQALAGSFPAFAAVLCASAAVEKTSPNRIEAAAGTDGTRQCMDGLLIV